MGNSQLAYTSETPAITAADWPAMKVRRVCNCGGEATAIAASETNATVRCQSCGRTFSAHMGRLEHWKINLDDKITYFQRRKEWARNLAKQEGLVSPGDSLDAVFEGCEVRITIGPRKGIRISGESPY